MRNENKEAPLQVQQLGAVDHLRTALRGSVLDPESLTFLDSEGSTYDHDPAIFIRGSAPRDLLAVSGAGATLDLSNGADLIDLCAMTENTVLGLNDPWVQLRQLSYVLSDRPHYVTVRMGSDLYYRVANRFVARFRDSAQTDDIVINMRECTGSGAIELALHAAWTAAKDSPKRRKLASFRGSFHGSNLGGILVSDHQPERGSGRVLVDDAPNVEYFAAPRLNESGALCEEAVEFLDMLASSGDDYFAVILEPVPWRNSVTPIPTEFLGRLRDVCTERRICLIFDEVQNGFGFTGSLGYGSICGVHSDISVFGKGLTSGHGTLSMMVARREYARIESPFGFKSNSANMLSLVAADAVLDRLFGMEPPEADHLPSWIPPPLAQSLRAGLLSTTYPTTVSVLDEVLEELRRRFPRRVGETTGVGLMRGLVLLDANGEPSAELAAQAATLCTTFGVHVRQATTALYFKPCLTLTRDEAEQAVERLARTIRHLDAS